MIERINLIFQLSLRGLLSGRRWLLVAALDGLFIALMAILALSTSGSHQQQFVDVFLALVLKILLPFIALLFASEALGAEIEDRTIVYLALRPLPAAAIVVPKFAAALLVTVGAVWVALLAGFLFLGGGDLALLAPMLLSTGAGAVAYSALFLLLGLLQRRALLIGAIYILLWEGAIALLSTGAAHLSVQFYALGVFTGLLSKQALLPSGLASPAGAGSALLLLLVTVSGVAQCSLRLRRIELR